MQSIEKEHLELIKALLGAFLRNDIAAIRRMLTDDVIFRFPGSNHFSGEYKGVDDSLMMLAKVAAWTGGKTQIRMHDVLANEQHGVLMYTVAAQRGDRSINYKYINLYHFRDGKVCEVWGVVQDCPEFDSFYSE